MTNRDDTPFLIVGHGIAGAVLAWVLYTKGIPFHVIDPDTVRSSSRVSSGLINPVTGRYFARSWRIDEVLPVARDTYRAIEAHTGKELLRQTRICRVLNSITQENEWASRMLSPSHENYMSFWDEPLPLPLKNTSFKPGKIEPVYQLMTSDMLTFLMNIWNAEGITQVGEFQHQDLVQEVDGWAYNGLLYRGVVFCEGYHVCNNPYFNWVPVEPTKGEVMLVKIKAAPADGITKHHCFIIPWENDLYWVGSNYEKYPGNDKVDMTLQNRLEERLSESLDAQFEVRERWTGIRPASKDRRPILGEHPIKKGLFIFNGLGTKGTVYTPYCAYQMAGLLSGDGTIDPELRLDRWPVPEI